MEKTRFNTLSKLVVFQSKKKFVSISYPPPKFRIKNTKMPNRLFSWQILMVKKMVIYQRKNLIFSSNFALVDENAFLGKSTFFLIWQFGLFDNIMFFILSKLNVASTSILKTKITISIDNYLNFLTIKYCLMFLDETTNSQSQKVEDGERIFRL